MERSAGVEYSTALPLLKRMVGMTGERKNWLRI
jgi:hypothetical protein